MTESGSLNRLAFDSFLHSQGEYGLQARFLLWLSEETEFEYDDFIDAIDSLKTPILQYIGSKDHLDRVRPSGFQDTITSLEKYKTKVNSSIPELYAALALIDEHMTAGNDGYKWRPRPKREIYQGRASPSHLALFGLLEVTTGLEEYDRAYKLIIKEHMDRTDNQSDDDYDLPRARRAIATHAFHNRQDADKLHELLRTPVLLSHHSF